MKALSVVTEETRLQPCAKCGETVRAALRVFVMRGAAGLLRGRAWVVVEHDCQAEVSAPEGA